MLEDDFSWVVRKAFKGLGLAPAEAARQAGLPENGVMAFSKGKFSEEIARHLAPVLGLNAEALVNHDRYEPAPLTLHGIRRLDLPFAGERVNAWLVSEGGSVILFDTGYDPRSCIDAPGSVWPDEIFITHTHPDHIGGIASFDGIPIHRSGGVFHCGPLVVRACDLSGHATPSLGYHIEGLALPVLVTGDALFAGSMGGCGTPALYQHALRRLKEILTPLPDATVLLPGHGPATTLGEERRKQSLLIKSGDVSSARPMRGGKRKVLPRFRLRQPSAGWTRHPPSSKVPQLQGTMIVERNLAEDPYSCIRGPMKTTIDLPDDVFLKTKILAAERRTTFKDLVIQGLELLTRTPPESVDKKRRAADLKRLLENMQASNTEPMVPLKREEIHDR